MAGYDRTAVQLYGRMLWWKIDYGYLRCRDHQRIKISNSVGYDGLDTSCIAAHHPRHTHRSTTLSPRPVTEQNTATASAATAMVEKPPPPTAKPPPVPPVDQQCFPPGKCRARDNESSHRCSRRCLMTCDQQQTGLAN